uniref:Uncharacterized protein n=1 Tax=Oryza nivara TaxID=4536 RepID=A0A0E0HPF4_ORYNI
MPPQIASSVRLRASFIHWRRSGALFRWCWWGYSSLLASPVPRFQNPNLQAPAAHYTSTPLTSCYTLPAACNGTTSPVLSAPPGGRTSLPCAAISSLRALSRRETWTPYLLAVATNSSIGNSAPAIYAFVALPAGLRCGASQGPKLLREDRGSLRSKSLVEKGSKRPNVKLTDPRKYFVQHAARLPYTAAWSSDNVKEEAIFTLVKDLATDLQNSPSEIVGYSGVKVVSLQKQIRLLHMCDIFRLSCIF